MSQTTQLIIAGNWKMNTTTNSAGRLIHSINQGISNINTNNIQVVVFPPFTHINNVNELADARISVGAQNCYYEPNGAFTGEVSTAMLEDIGCHYVLIGHSERRSIFKESLSVIELKLQSVLQSTLIPILCIGETLAERQSGNTWSVLQQQLDTSLSKINREQSSKIIIAYEPVWAIGTGVAATKEEAQEAHHFIRNHLVTLGIDSSIKILYGGSVTQDNADSLLRQDDIDGALIGGASLKADAFVSIIRTAVDICEN